MTSSDSAATAIDAVAEELLASIDHIWDRAYSALLAIPSYRQISRGALHASHALNVERAADTLRSGRLPRPGSMSEAQSTTIERLSAGLPIEDIIRGYRLSIGATFERYVDLANRARLDDDDLMRGIRLLWGLSDLFVEQAVLAHQRYAVDIAIGEARLRNDHVRAALSGRATSEDLEQWLPEAHGQFRALLARVNLEGGDLDDARLRVDRALSAIHARGIIGAADGVITGYVLEAIPHPVEGLSMAVGHLVEFDELPASYQIARALLGATHHDEAVSTVETSGWRLTVTSVEPLAKHLRSRYLDPLIELGPFGDDLLRTLATFLECDRRVDDCAAVLTLHPNTLRHRLRRLSEILDVDLQRTSTIIELSMAIELAQRPSP
jgi:putative transposase